MARDVVQNRALNGFNSVPWANQQAFAAVLIEELIGNTREGSQRNPKDIVMTDGEYKLRFTLGYDGDEEDEDLIVASITYSGFLAFRSTFGLNGNTNSTFDFCSNFVAAVKRLRILANTPLCEVCNVRPEVSGYKRCYRCAILSFRPTSE
jgi:hypothetical protein